MKKVLTVMMSLMMVMVFASASVMHPAKVSAASTVELFHEYFESKSAVKVSNSGKTVTYNGITYDMNGGKAVWVAGNGYNFTMSSPGKIFFFDHWNTKADDSGKKYSSGDEISASKAKTIKKLYAIWEYEVVLFYECCGNNDDVKVINGGASAIYNGITYDMNGGIITWDKKQKVYFFDKVTESGYGLSWEHWNTKPDGTGKNYYADSTEISEEDGKPVEKLYAVWEKEPENEYYNGEEYYDSETSENDEGYSDGEDEVRDDEEDDECYDDDENTDEYCDDEDAEDGEYYDDDEDEYYDDESDDQTEEPEQPADDTEEPDDQGMQGEPDDQTDETEQPADDTEEPDDTAYEEPAIDDGDDIEEPEEPDDTAYEEPAGTAYDKPAMDEYEEVVKPVIGWKTIAEVDKGQMKDIEDAVETAAAVPHAVQTGDDNWAIPCLAGMMLFAALAGLAIIIRSRSGRTKAIS